MMTMAMPLINWLAISPLNTSCSMASTVVRVVMRMGRIRVLPVATIVIICGLSYATLMTLYIVPVLYDILFKKPPLNVDVGSDDDLDDIPDDAAEFIAAQKSAGTAQPEA